MPRIATEPEDAERQLICLQLHARTQAEDLLDIIDMNTLNFEDGML